MDKLQRHNQPVQVGQVLRNAQKQPSVVKFKQHSISHSPTSGKVRLNHSKATAISRVQ